MKLLADGPNIPEELLTAQERGEVIFICGAGVSMTLGLPSFKGLVEAIYESFGENWDLHPAEREVMRPDGTLRGQYDRVLRALELEGFYMTAPRSLVGRCLCGRLEYEVDDAFEYAMNCHCSQCRRSTGSAFKPLAGIEASRLVMRRGQADALKYGDEGGHDLHCGVCGSLLFSLVRDGRYVHVAMGTLVDEPSILPSMHIFVGSKAAWFEITDALPQYHGLPVHG